MVMKNKRWISLLFLASVLLYGCQRQETVSSDSTVIGEERMSAEGSESNQINHSSSETLPAPMSETFSPNDLLKSVKEGDLNQVEKILTDKGYNIEEIDQEGNTPLNVAVHNNQVEIAKLLIDCGADINQQNTISDSPYLYAGAEGRTEILAYMLSKGDPDLSKVNRFGGNALIPAAEKGHLDTVRLLLEDGRVEVDFQNNYGYTALIETVALNDGSQLYQDIAKALLDRGASKTLKDNSGKSAVDYAANYGYLGMTQLLQNY